MFINIYIANTGPEQLHILSGLISILETFEDIQNKSVVLGGEFNVISNPSLDFEGAKPVIEKETIEKLIQITENLGLCHIWRTIYLCNTILMVLLKMFRLFFHIQFSPRIY